MWLCFCLSILEVRTLEYEMCVLSIFSLIRMRQIIFLAILQFFLHIEQSWLMKKKFLPFEGQILAL